MNIFKVVFNCEFFDVIKNHRTKATRAKLSYFMATVGDCFFHTMENFSYINLVTFEMKNLLPTVTVPLMEKLARIIFDQWTFHRLQSQKTCISNNVDHPSKFQVSQFVCILKIIAAFTIQFSKKEQVCSKFCFYMCNMFFHPKYSSFYLKIIPQKIV